MDAKVIGEKERNRERCEIVRGEGGEKEDKRQRTNVNEKEKKKGGRGERGERKRDSFHNRKHIRSCFQKFEIISGTFMRHFVLTARS